MRVWCRGLVLTATILAGTVSVARVLAAGAVFFCSTSAFPVARGEGVYFLGAATPDTVLAGAGAMRYERELAPGRPWPTREVYGQVVSVGRLAGRDSAALEAAFAARGRREVIVVPWDRDGGCRTIVYVGSARFMEDGEAGFFSPQLRARADWAGGVPTFDAYPWSEPYPSGSAYNRRYAVHDTVTAARTADALTAEEYMELYAAIPTVGPEEPGYREQAERLWEWERRHPGLARRWPATEVLIMIRELVAPAP